MGCFLVPTSQSWTEIDQGHCCKSFSLRLTESALQPEFQTLYELTQSTNGSRKPLIASHGIGLQSCSDLWRAQTLLIQLSSSGNLMRLAFSILQATWTKPLLWPSSSQQMTKIGWETDRCRRPQWASKQAPYCSHGVQFCVQFVKSWMPKAVPLRVSFSAVHNQVGLAEAALAEVFEVLLQSLAPGNHWLQRIRPINTSAVCQSSYRGSCCKICEYGISWISPFWWGRVIPHRAARCKVLLLDCYTLRSGHPNLDFILEQFKRSFDHIDFNLFNSNSNELR